MSPISLLLPRERARAGGSGRVKTRRSYPISCDAGRNINSRSGYRRRNVAMARFVTHLVNRQSSPLNTSSLHPASEGPRSWFIHRKEELDPDFLEDHVTRCPEGDCVARMGRANA